MTQQTQDLLELVRDTLTNILLHAERNKTMTAGDLAARWALVDAV